VDASDFLKKQGYEVSRVSIPVRRRDQACCEAQYDLDSEGSFKGTGRMNNGVEASMGRKRRAAGNWTCFAQQR